MDRDEQISAQLDPPTQIDHQHARTYMDGYRFEFLFYSDFEWAMDFIFLVWYLLDQIIIIIFLKNPAYTQLPTSSLNFSLSLPHSLPLPHLCRFASLLHSTTPPHSQTALSSSTHEAHSLSLILTISSNSPSLSFLSLSLRLTKLRGRNQNFETLKDKIKKKNYILNPII